MEIFPCLSQFSPTARPTAVAIGNFDGVHVGHQRILKTLVAAAIKDGLQSVVLTFSPHPEKVLGRGPIKMIQTLDQRLASIGRSGVDATLVVPFNRRFSSFSTEDFAAKVLAGALKARKVLVGCNFHFGKGRLGDRRTLADLGKKYGFAVSPIPPVLRAGRVVSSSLIRNLLSRGDIGQANRLLGRPYEIAGVVIRGAGRGKELGFPTANLETENEILPPGVFVSTTGWGRQRFPSLSDVGENPTYGEEPLHLETYILDLKRGLYGKTLVVRFLKRIRDEKKFENSEALIHRMDKDVALARAYFAGRSLP